MYRPTTRTINTNTKYIQGFYRLEEWCLYTTLFTITGREKQKHKKNQTNNIFILFLCKTATTGGYNTLSVPEKMFARVLSHKLLHKQWEIANFDFHVLKPLNKFWWNLTRRTIPQRVLTCKISLPSDDVGDLGAYLVSFRFFSLSFFFLVFSPRLRIELVDWIGWSMSRISARTDVPFGVLLKLFPILGSNLPKLPKGSANSHFQAKLWKTQNCHNFKTGNQVCIKFGDRK